MPRRPRQEEAGAIYHVFAHGVESIRVFDDDRDRRDYLRLLGAVTARANWRVYAYCLMNTHLHLLIQTPDANLGEGMCSLHGDYARRFNRRHGRRGHLFESRYGAVRIETDAQLAVVAAYIANNPVKAGLCTRPEDWRWSSYGRVLAGEAPPWVDVNGLLGFFAASGGDPYHRYIDMTAGNC